MRDLQPVEAVSPVELINQVVAAELRVDQASLDDAFVELTKREK